MLELTQDQIKAIKYNKIKELKALIKEIADSFRHNKYAFKKNTSLTYKLNIECKKESGLAAEPFSFAKLKLYQGLYNERMQKLETIEYKKTNHLFPWVKENYGCSTLCVDKSGKSFRITIEHDKDTYNVITTLYHILYNKLKNKKRGHTNDDAKWIETYKDHWKLMLERMEVQQELLGVDLVKS